MAPSPMPLESVNDDLKNVIQNLYDIQNSAYAFQGPATQQDLMRKVPELAANLLILTNSSSSLSMQIPPEIIDYVDTGRNPDIYTREFVELVQARNQELKSKSEAFASFRDILAEELTKAMPEVKSDVARILAGGPVVESKSENGDKAGT